MRRRSSLSPLRRLGSALVHLLLWTSASVTCALVLYLTGCILFRGAPGLSLELLTSQESVLNGSVGILPAVCNTLFVIAISLALVLPLGVGAALYLTEYAPSRRLAAAITFAVDALAGLPSILYAMAGMIIFCSALGLQKTLLAGSLTLAVMNLPTVIRSTQESLKSVPRAYREGALGLGSGRWRMIRTLVLPCSAGGIASGCMLAVGRVVGESAVLLYTAGLSTAMQDFSTLQGIRSASGATLAAALYIYAKERADFAAAFSIAAVLLLLTLFIRLAASLAGRWVGR